MRCVEVSFLNDSHSQLRNNPDTCFVTQHNLTQAKTLKGHQKHFHGAEYPETGSPVWLFQESSTSSRDMNINFIMFSCSLTTHFQNIFNCKFTIDNTIIIQSWKFSWGIFWGLMEEQDIYRECAVMKRLRTANLHQSHRTDINPFQVEALFFFFFFWKQGRLHFFSYFPPLNSIFILMSMSENQDI